MNDVIKYKKSCNDFYINIILYHSEVKNIIEKDLFMFIGSNNLECKYFEVVNDEYIFNVKLRFVDDIYSDCFFEAQIEAKTMGFTRDNRKEIILVLIRYLKEKYGE